MSYDTMIRYLGEAKFSEIFNFLERVFSFDSSTLPKNKEWYKYTDNYIDMSGIFLRDIYTKKCFPILSHEFLVSLQNMVDQFNFQIITKLSCGTGWLSYWMKKYGINVFKSVDNKSWHRFQNEDYLDFVFEFDSIDFVKNNPDCDLFVLSWPGMDSVAVDIWNSMREGQYLLYIGEDRYGCTANDEFFDAIEGKEVECDFDFVQFDGIHDFPRLFKK